MHTLIFDEEKATQAAAFLLRLRSGSMSYMKLIKLLYLADRTALLRYGKPITFDAWYSLKHGPILSNVLNLITDPSRLDSSGYWSQTISAPLGDHEVSLLRQAGTDRLSQAEETILQQVFETYGHYDLWTLVDLLHNGQIAPEWKQPPQGSRIPISLRDVFTTELESEEAEMAERELFSMVRVSSLCPR